MRYAVISDIHSNLEALEAVLAGIEDIGIRDVIFIGDAVGYGPNPNECTEMLSERCKALVAGNHDWAVIGLSDASFFNEYARRAVEWTSEVIEEKNKEVLRSMPLVEEDKKRDAFFVHATPRRPEEWSYLLNLWDAELNFYSFEEKVCFIGHSHQPFIVEKVPSGEVVAHSESVRIKGDSRYIINAGSVGQPRDGDPRACFAVVDDDRVKIVRIPYDIEKVQEKMRQELLPYPLIERLAAGR
jgi:diadenosine tetraphosphatase ApaH/serine/threonine PP2A family protein phosphatase